MVAAPFLIISLALALSSRFNSAFKFGVAWIVIFGIIMIPIYVLIILNISWGYYSTLFNYLTVGFVFYALVIASNVLLYKNRADVPLKLKKMKGMIVGSEASHYCRFCGAEIKEGETTCPNCESSLTEA